MVLEGPSPNSSPSELRAGFGGSKRQNYFLIGGKSSWVSVRINALSSEYLDDSPLRAIRLDTSCWVMIPRVSQGTD